MSPSPVLFAVERSTIFPIALRVNTRRTLLIRWRRAKSIRTERATPFPLRTPLRQTGAQMERPRKAQTSGSADTAAGAQLFTTQRATTVIQSFLVIGWSRSPPESARCACRATSGCPAAARMAALTAETETNGANLDPQEHLLVRNPPTRSPGSQAHRCPPGRPRQAEAARRLVAVRHAGVTTTCPLRQVCPDRGHRVRTVAAAEGEADALVAVARAVEGDGVAPSDERVEVRFGATCMRWAWTGR